MTPEYVVGFGREALEVMLTVVVPLLLLALGVGLTISLVQAITQVNEATLSFLPKLLAVAIGLVLMGPWIISQLTEFIVRTLTSLPQAITGG